MGLSSANPSKRGRKPYRSTSGGRTRLVRKEGRDVAGTCLLPTTTARSGWSSTSKRWSHSCALTVTVLYVRTHSANKTSPSRRFLQRLNSSTAPRKTPFISRSVTIRPDAARSLPPALASAFFFLSSCILLMHFLASKRPQGCRFAMYPPKYPFVFACALISLRCIRRARLSLRKFFLQDASPR